MDVINTFVGGMRKDIDKSLMSNKTYLDAHNFRIVTTKGSTSGSLENIKGNIVLSTGDVITSGQRIIGSCEIRDKLVLFTTNNLTPGTPASGTSKIYVAEINLITEAQTSLTCIYDDNLNAGLGTSDFLNFSVAYPIKAVCRYETPNIQKVYWTDGYNNVRFCDIGKYLTVDGEAYVNPGDYMSVDKFEFLPKFVGSKPTLSNIVGGKLRSGIVAYSYQLYNLNGAETSFSPTSDPFAVTSCNDFMSNTFTYRGDSEEKNTGKGFIISINNTANTGYNRLRLIRIEYSAINELPKIYICNEIEIDTAGSTVLITDIGDVIGELTVDEFNIISTELFSCQDLAIKDNRLFAANIEKSDFTVDSFDCRAIRFRAGEVLSSSDITNSIAAIDHADSEVTISRQGDSTILVTITTASTYLGIPSGRTVLDGIGTGNGFTAVATVRTVGNVVSGVWYDAASNPTGYSSTVAETSLALDSYTAATDTLTFTATTIGSAYFGPAFWSIHYGFVYEIIFTYNYTYDTSYEDAYLYDTDGVSSIIITKPTDPDVVADWNTAGWTNYTSDHDGINIYNNPDNDGDYLYRYVYQGDCQTIGAEGPNVKIDFETESFVLDSSGNDAIFYASTPGTGVNTSYTNYASVWQGGKLSWQRDEIYRLYAVWGNDRGQLSDPKWIIDLRMPSFHEADFTNSSSETVKASVLADISGTTVVSYRLYPRILFKSFPSNATWVQVYRVKRDRADRSVVTQGLAIPTNNAAEEYTALDLDNVILATNGIELVKLVSPEININKNIAKQANDYIEYITHFYGTPGTTTVKTPSTTDGYYRYIHKLKENTRVAYTVGCKSVVNDAIAILPHSASTEDVTVDGKQYTNYHSAHAKGSTGLLISYDNETWAAEGARYVLVNYKSDNYGSQYGGYTFEDRAYNVSIPCSDIIKYNQVSTWFDIDGGDTFINYYDVSTFLFDLAQADNGASFSESAYVPLESSVNCDLRYDDSQAHLTYSNTDATLRQEYAGTHVLSDGSEYIQDKDLYLYNTVYSQLIDIKYAISLPSDAVIETDFDCMVKASNVKDNGELSDSWTKFGVNEFIEVETSYGPINALSNFNDRLIYFQDKAFGLLSINERSLITDQASAALVLGTGGILDRYTYVANQTGCKDKFSICNSKSGLYWYDRLINSIYRYSDTLINLTKVKELQSYLDNSTVITSAAKVLSYSDIKNDEVLFTFYQESATSGFTISYNELVDAYVSFYDFIPTIYIPFNFRYLTTTNSYYCSSDFNRDRLFLHDSSTWDRCYFYALTTGVAGKYVDSTLKLLFNPEYEYTKVFDNFFYISNSYSTTADIFADTFATVRCYNDYQNTDYITLTPTTNIRRRERGWTLAVPRNAVNANVSTNPDIFSALDQSQTFKERMRDKYLISDFTYDNDGTYDRFVISNMGLRYRSSIR